MSNNTDTPDNTGELNISCDGCGKGLLIDSNVRYEVTIDVRAAYDPAEITRDDLEGDLEAEIERTIDAMNDLSEQEAREQVHKTMSFQLCRSCQKKYLQHPLPTLDDD